VKRESFDFIARALRRRCGVALGEDKAYLVEARLAPLANLLGLAGIDDLAKSLRNASDDKLEAHIAEAIMTTDSAFFRDVKPFHLLRQAILPGLAALRKKSGADRIRVWSAGCAGGQEPFSIAMIAREDREKLGIDVEIVATDLSAGAVAKARRGQ
jgi:chemotaxis protein methyltransferase CheR